MALALAPMLIFFAQIKAPVDAHARAADVRPADVRVGPTRPSSDAAKRQRDEEERYLRERRERETREAAEQAARERLEAELAARQMRMQRERAGLVAPSLGRGLSGIGAGPLQTALDADGNLVRTGGLELATTATVVEGYNDNVVQTIDNPADRLVRRRGSPFVGVDVMGIAQYLGPRVEHDFRLQVRGQHYTPISKGYDFTDDGTINVGYQGRYQASPTTTVAALITSTLSTLSSSRQSDGVVFRIDPYASQRTFTLTTARLAAETELAPRWRFVAGVDLAVATILYDAPILLQSGQRIIPRGLDFWQPRADATLFHDFDYDNVGFARLRYEYLSSRLALDLGSNPPRNSGPITTHIGELQAGWTHLFSSTFSSSTVLGAQIATPFASDVDQRYILSPTAYQSVAYVTPTLFVGAGAGYTYGSVNPRIGFGTSIDATATMVATPFERTAALRRLSILVNGQVSRATLRSSASTRSELNTYAASVELRYGVNDWLALMAGYSYRFAGVSNLDAIPPLWRSIAFVGLTLFWSTERELPPLVNFAPPLTGG